RLLEPADDLRKRRRHALPAWRLHAHAGADRLTFRPAVIPAWLPPVTRRLKEASSSILLPMAMAVFMARGPWRCRRRQLFSSHADTGSVATGSLARELWLFPRGRSCS